MRDRIYGIYNINIQCIYAENYGDFHHESVNKTLFRVCIVTTNSYSEYHEYTLIVCTEYVCSITRIWF